MNLPSSHIPNRQGSRRGSGSGVMSLIPTRDLRCTSPSQKAAAAAATVTTTPSTTPSKSKRVRTGCLTCRKRHLKCDEAFPDCLHCLKSNRQCKRGLRVNFIDLQVGQPPPSLPRSADWSVRFRDESRHIASGYVGGLRRYAHLPPDPDASTSRGRQVNASPGQQQQQQQQQHQHHPSSYLNTQYNHQPADSNPSPDSTANNFPLMPSLPLPAITPMHGYSSQMFTSEPRCPPPQNEPSFPTPQPSSHTGPYGYPLQDHQFTAFPQEAASISQQPQQHAHRSSGPSNPASIAPPLSTGQPPTFRGRGVVQRHGHVAGDGMMTPPASEKAVAGERDHLNSADEMLYMQIFVQEVAVWMDALDKGKHFSRLIPYLSLKSPMLLNALLACGVKHLALTHPDVQHDKVLHYYYDTATTQLLRSLQNPDRNTAECATTAVVLNAYEIMSEKPGQAVCMNHITGARALIRECGWDARSTGMGAACFWLDVGMEVLSCLAFDWQTSWDPDHWGLDVDVGVDFSAFPDTQRELNGAVAATAETGASGQEEEWAQRIFYIVAKVANFRAATPKFPEGNPHDEQVRVTNRLRQWHELKRLCDRWNTSCPRTMRPFGYLYPSQSEPRSSFPHIWLINPVAVIGRLVYHTAQCLLARTNPVEPARASEEMRVLQLHHAQQVCGLAAHCQDRGVASVATRCMAVAGPVLTNPREQEEVIDILERIHKASGWDPGTVTAELERVWGWTATATTTTAAAATRARTTAADPIIDRGLGGPNQPCQNWYGPPNRPNPFSSQDIL
ncbi:hypothetical protein SODALDRAFT_335846 [Sodiomyces alkalinus F11]|uniref:Zn(2)-C6 fungal-type domain-containing protein n=1 Tax=Sodiomyces alkalinus (strain CBS 110278 / VKM F-3762 / F11) TaxID=1314773 RepID=A0A3N2Q541_SODAK|nr:hypothetical protein SODALDRAFT_335846 [Sodiomyces alkalinus F11]ROT41890.1 hypothetical protein SODALDRAFT_335846 [Sodiomyces alkalinus F11]